MITFQHGSYIDKAIESVVEQDEKRLELVVGDDQSTDDTLERALAWQSRYPDIVRVLDPVPDKLLGRRFLDGKTPLADHPMVVSGRASFEILQKALVAGVPMIVAVGAPSSLAVEMAERFGMTLIGFASRERFNIYTRPERVVNE